MPERIRPIAERMTDAKVRLIARNRTPRVFFLGPDDFTEFKATEPDTIEALFSLPLGSPPNLITCLAFDGIAVRPTYRKPDKYGRVVGALYCCAGTIVSVPRS